jgi:lipid II:glycine glycyltransferase (peptidoglycan interpeptide bridge formation enzyme)
MTAIRAERAIENLQEHARLPGITLERPSTLAFEFVEVSRCPPRTLQEISEFLDTQRTSHPFQWPHWSFENDLIALLRCEGRIRWLAQCGVLYPASRFLKPIKVLLVNRGPVCDDPELMELGLRRFIAEGRTHGFAYVDIAPEWTGEFAELTSSILSHHSWQPQGEKRSSLRLALSPSLDEILASLRSTTRYKIRRSESGGVEVSIADDEATFFEFFRLYEKMANEKQFSAEGSEFLLRAFRGLVNDPRRGAFFLAREDGKLRGGILIIRCGVHCWYILGATTKDSKFSAGHLLQWRAIEWAKRQGCLEYDFGGFREGMATGPAYFKSGFSDRVVHFPPAYRYVLNPSRHRALKLVLRVRRSLQK